MADWFLPPGVPGSSDEWCFATTSTFDLRVYVSYADYYARLADLFAQAETNDEIFVVGWGFALEEILKDKKSALLFLEAARGRKARVRLLSTPTHQYNDNDLQMSDAVAKNLDAVIDRQLPPGTVRHHQKAVLIKLKSTTHLFVGGMDITIDRVNQFFDVQAEIIGVGASLGRKTLEERWESVKPPLGGVSGTTRPLGASNKDDSYKVQFVRTYPPFPADTTNWKRTYAKDGDHTYYALICRAIAAARKSIYLEEQFLWPMVSAPTRSNPAGGSVPKLRGDVPDIPDTLERLMKEAIARGIKVVIIAANYPPNHVFKTNRDPVLRTLQNASNPPVLLKVRAGMMVVHSKTWIFDDEFIVIGSANFWANSFVSVHTPAEAEFGVAFTSNGDGASLGFPKLTFARALRLRLWERIRQTRDPSYVFPRNAAASFDDEVTELQSAINGTAPFEPM
jgi:phosphatidylserine/phosphatidylglycerophosphate/cardiolipin synthase-like enzyme